MNPSNGISNSNIQVVQHPLNHRCSQHALVFEQSGSVKDKRDAASAIVELMSTASIEEIRSCPRPSGFTLFHLIPMAEGVDDGTKSTLFERLMADAEMCILVDQPNNSISADQLCFEASNRKMPLANGDRPSHVAVFAGSKEDVSRQLHALEQQGLKDCWSNNTGNNLFNLAAGKSLEIFNLVFNFYQPHEKFGEYITNSTNFLVTPAHHACRSTNADKLQILARLLVAGAEHSLSQDDDRNMTPLEHLKPDSQQYLQLMNLVKEDPQLLQMGEQARTERLQAIEKAISSAFEKVDEKKTFMSMTHAQKGVMP